VHGGVSDLRTWANQVDVFAERYRTICYSRRYHLPNAPIPEQASDPIQTHVDDLADLIETLRADPAHIVGHSWGGLISLLLALQCPHLCRGLVLIEPPVVSMHVTIPPTFLQMVRLFLRSPALAVAIAKLGGRALGPAESAFRRGNDKAAIEYFGRGVLGKRRFSSLTAERYHQVWDNRGPDRVQTLHHGFPNLMGETFSAVTHPVLLISGSDSPAIFDLLNEGVRERLPHARKRLIPHASHIVHEDAPQELNAAVLAFLDEVG
jgi:pimeloyl-ACP methyl ester carboxylesterase